MFSFLFFPCLPLHLITPYAAPFISSPLPAAVYYLALLLLFAVLLDNWGEKAKRRRTEGTGRMSYLKDVPRRAKNGFRENTQAPARRVAAPKKK